MEGLRREEDLEERRMKRARRDGVEGRGGMRIGSNTLMVA